MVTNKADLWLATVDHASSPYQTLPGCTQQELLDNFFRQSYLLTDIPFFQLFVQRLAQALPVRAALAVYHTDDGQGRVLAFCLNGQLVGELSYELETAPCSQLVHRETVQYVDGITAVYPIFCAQLGLQLDCYMGIPLTAANGRLLGHLLLLHDAAIQLPLRNWSAWPVLLARAGIELERLQTAVQQTNTLRDLEQRTEQLSALYEAALELTPSPDWPELTQIIARRITTLLHLPPHTLYLALYLPNRATNSLPLQQQFPPGSRPVYLCEPPTSPLRRYVAQTGEAHIASALPEDALVYLMPDETRHMHVIRSSILLPLITGEKLAGLLYIGLRDSHTFLPDQIGSLMAFSDMLADLLHRIDHLRALQAQVAQSQTSIMAVEARLQALNQLRTKLVRDITHELFTPITSVRLYLDLLAYSQLDQNGQRYVEVLRNKTRQLIQFAEDVLQLSRLENDHPPTFFQPIQLPHDLKPLFTLYTQLAQQTGLRLAVQSAPKLPRLAGDPNQLRQAVAILLDNAIAYTDEGTITVQLQLNATGTFLGIRVTDSGCGIAATDMPHIFDRFYRGGQQHSGRGLGLSIAQEIIRLHQGYIEVESEPGQGATFRLWLPCSKDAGVA